MAQILQPFECSLVNGDLSDNHTIQDALTAIEQLNTLCQNVLNRVETRIKEERARVDAAAARADKCAVRAMKIKGTTRATTVFSTAKFPAPRDLPSMQALFNQLSQQVQLVALLYDTRSI